MSKLKHQPTLSRRACLIGSAGTAIAFGFARTGAIADETSPFEPTIWYSIDRSGIVTVNITRAEMGQHIGTALARILADELEVDWSNIRLSAVDTDPKWGIMVTGGSRSVSDDFPVYSRAGAAGRIALIEAGAKLLGESPSRCFARQGAVFAANRSISYGEIVRRGGPARKFTPNELAELPIKQASERRLIGQKADALDIPAKINGTARYGIDASVSGMVYARPKIPPTRNDRAESAAIVSDCRCCARDVRGCRDDCPFTIAGGHASRGRNAAHRRHRRRSSPGRLASHAAAQEPGARVLVGQPGATETPFSR